MFVYSCKYSLWISHSPAVTLITESRETEIDALWIRTWLEVAALGNKKVNK